MRQTKGLMVLIVLIALININAVAVSSTDTTPPTTVLTYLSTSGYKIVPIDGTFNQSVNITLTSTDIGSGIKYVSYNITGGGTTTYTIININGAPTTTFTNIPTISNEGLTIVEYYATDNASNTEAEKVVNFTIKPNPSAPPCTTCAAASGGGGGGGGGGVSGENYSNIVLKEKYEEAIYKDKPTSFMFKSASSPVMFINITGNVNAGLINTAAELLRDTSTLVSEAPPGLVYKNINLWVGTSGFATSKNIKEAIVMFRVDNAWIDSNTISRSDIKLVKWDGEKWIILETSEKMKDGTYTYFDGKTTSFSPFAITVINAATNTAERKTTISSTVPVPTGTQQIPAEKEEVMAVNLSLVAGIIGIIAIVVVLYLRRKN
ncbi:MAG: PGF-pre-PGF domain-containing protein [Candidatus Methanoperedens sp.]|nr:PGF-pre-PGF domain-containing protein [Candidatus Methanoperedens sp.]